MKTLLLMAGTLALAVALGPAPALGDIPPAATATVDVMLTILPYAEVTLDSPTVTVTLPEEGGNSQPVYVGGSVTTNCSVMLFADIEPPAGAPGSWYATLMVPQVDQPGFHEFAQLVRINVLNIPPGPGGSVTLDALGSSLGGYPTAEGGQGVITVMQM